MLEGRLRMTRKIPLIALASVIFSLTGTAVAQKASVPKQPDKAAMECPCARVVARHGHRQEWQDLQTRMDEVYGSGVRPIGQGQNGAAFSPRTCSIEGERQSEAVRSSRQVTRYSSRWEWARTSLSPDEVAYQRRRAQSLSTFAKTDNSAEYCSRPAVVDLSLDKPREREGS